MNPVMLKISRLCTLALGLALYGMAAPGTAGPLIKFTDLDPDVAAMARGSLSDLSINLAGSWTQSVASSNVTLSALINNNVAPGTGDWYVTRSIGAGTTSADVVSSGVYTVGAPLSADQFKNFNLAPRVVLGSGLSFAPGTYFLVLDGPAGPFVNNAEWLGDRTADILLSSSFSLGSFFATDDPAGFAPASNFSSLSPFTLVFELDGDIGVVPLPASLPLLAAGLAMFGLFRRRATIRA